MSSSGKKTRVLSKEPTLAKQRTKSGKLNSCQADGWRYHETLRLPVLLEKVVNSSILLLRICFFYLSR